MAHESERPCDEDGVCGTCMNKPSEDEIHPCKTCGTVWHFKCVTDGPKTLADALHWECPDCSSIFGGNPAPIAGRSDGVGGLIAAIRAIESDTALLEREKARKRQELMSGGGARSRSYEGEGSNQGEKISGDDDVLDILDGSLNCSICKELLDRPVTTPCGHNFCLKCFQKWIGMGNYTCANCRSGISSQMASKLRINSTLVDAIRMVKSSKPVTNGGPPKVYHFVCNQNRPDKAYTTERAKKPGNANACSGKIFVTIPPDHFGPILVQHDPVRKQGVMVGDSWTDRLECRQWGVHFPHVAGIAGQSKHGAQSVALSGGYEDDEDHGEWFLYTGSGGRDLGGNKRTNKAHSYDQKFQKLNEALRVSCREGYPVRVVRSHKEKRSSYAPEKGIRYDGIYRIEKCWRKAGKQGFKVCRYLFVRCDNDPAPWMSDDHGDRPRELPVVKELKNATDITERKGSPSWDYDEEKGYWMWKKPPPQSRKLPSNENSEYEKRTRKFKRQTQSMSVREKFLKELSCSICKMVMTSPLTTPCAHNFCKACLEGAFAGQTFMRQRTCEGRRTLRAQKNIMKCPSCLNDIADFLRNPQVNRELMSIIESLQCKIVEMEHNAEDAEESSEKIDCISEKPDAVGGDTEINDVNNEILEEAKEEILKPHIETKAQQTYKRKKASAVRSKLSSNNEAQETAVVARIKQTYKRKKANDGGNESMLNCGVMTRCKKAKKW